MVIKMKVSQARKKLPNSFKPLLWSFKWDAIDIEEDKEDIIVNVINEGTLDHWRWVIKIYGKDEIKRVLMSRLSSEFHPESRNLAEVIFGIPYFRRAR